MQFGIDSRLYDSSLVLGRKGLFLDASDLGLQLTPSRPAAGVIYRIERIFDNHSAELERELGQRSVVEVNTFFRNITYFTEKVTANGRWEQHSSLDKYVPLFFAVVVVEMIAKAVINRDEEVLSKKALGLFSLVAVYLATHALSYAKIYQQQYVGGRMGQKKCEAIRDKLLEIVKRLSPIRSLADKATEGVQFAGLDRIFTIHKPIIDQMPAQEQVLARMAYRQVLSLVQQKKAEGMCVFLHGQSHETAILAKFYTKVIKKLEPERQIDDFQFMRLISSHSLQQSRYKTAWEFLLYNGFVIVDFIPRLREQLLSVSVNPLEWSKEESAFAFWLKDIGLDFSCADVAIEAVKKEMALGVEAEALIKEKFRELSAIFKKSEKRVGNLVAICIPAKFLENPNRRIGYHCYPFGMPASMFCTEKIAALASQEWLSSAPCQARLLAHQLVPENHIETHNFNTLAPEETTQCDALLDNLVDALAKL